jgi:Mg-chelatase subunit ChlD
VAVLVAVVLPVLLGMIGLAVDLGNVYLSHSRIQAAVDAAALAGSLELPYDPEITNGRVATASAGMLAKNYPEAHVAALTAGTEVRSVCVTGEADVDMLFMGAVGLLSSTVQAKACAGFNDLEIVFVIDNSGSMKGTPITNTNAAASELVNLLIPDGASPAIKFGLVPFRGKVHIPGDVDGLADGCRNADGTLNTGLLSEYTKPEYRYPRGSYLRVSSDTCSSIPRVRGLTEDKSEILAAIASQTALGAASGTLIGEGVKWGRHVLTPEPPYEEGDDSDRMRKIMILLTDGDTEDGGCGGAYSVYYTPNDYWTNAWYGMGVTDAHCQDGGPLNAAMLEQAQLAKDAGVEIFTIRYGSSDAVDVSLMQQVASSKTGTNDHYFDAPSADDIEDIFRKIGKHLGWRLLQ